MERVLNPREREFVDRFRALLQEFDVAIEGTEWSGYTGGGCDQIVIESEYNVPVEDQPIRIEFNSRFISPDFKLKDRD